MHTCSTAPTMQTDQPTQLQPLTSRGREVLGLLARACPTPKSRPPCSSAGHRQDPRRPHPLKTGPAGLGPRPRAPLPVRAGPAGLPDQPGRHGSVTKDSRPHRRRPADTDPTTTRPTEPVAALAVVSVSVSFTDVRRRACAIRPRLIQRGHTVLTVCGPRISDLESGCRARPSRRGRNAPADMAPHHPHAARLARQVLLRSDFER
jgi:hypothetical protein